MELDERWYLCRVEDSSVDDEPDFSKIPEAKREMVRKNWLAKQKPVFETVNLWGPQISFFQEQPYYKITVLELDTPYAEP